MSTAAAVAAEVEREASLLYRIGIGKGGGGASGGGAIGRRASSRAGPRAHHGAGQGHEAGRARAGSGSRRGAPRFAGSSGRATLERTAARHTEVVVKVTGVKKSAQGVASSVDYLSRQGRYELETDKGTVVHGREENRDLVDRWANAAPRMQVEDGPHREAYNLVLSMPAGTDPAVVNDSARAFAAKEFGENHRWLSVLHPDTDHVHVHVMVKAAGRDGHRLQQGPEDLRRWRDAFAEELRERGVAANATSREVRGVVTRSEKAAIFQMQRDHDRGKIRKTPSRVVEARQRELAEAERKIVEREQGTAAYPGIREKHGRRGEIKASYGRIHERLTGGSAEDRATASAVVALVASFAPITATRTMLRTVERVRPLLEARSAQEARQAAGATVRAGQGTGPGAPPASGTTTVAPDAQRPGWGHARSSHDESDGRRGPRLR